MQLTPQHIEESYNKEVASIVQKAGDLLRSKYGLWFLGIFAIADAALGLPLSTDPFMVAYMFANRANALWGYIITVCGSVLGGVIAYFLAQFLSERLFGYVPGHFSGLLDHLIMGFDRHAFLISFIGSFSPFPFTLLAVAAGALKINLFMFIAGALLGRAIRYGIVAYVAYFFGKRAVAIAKRNILRTSIVFLVLITLLILSKILL